MISAEADNKRLLIPGSDSIMMGKEDADDE